MRNPHKKPSLRWFFFGGLIALLILLPWKWMNQRYSRHIYTSQFSPSRWLAIVLGAGLRRDGKPFFVLADRVATAVKLYQEGKVVKILMSGSVNHPFYDEPGAMRELAMQMGVRDEDILLDRDGSRTFESCRRARQLFNVDSALLVSQSFHLPRALAICDALGMNAVGVSADLRSYGPFAMHFWRLREIPAALIALWDSYIAPAIDLRRNRLLPKRTI
jgi:SanA protein